MSKQKNDTTPTCDARFFIDNRRRLAEKLPGHVLLFSAHCLQQLSADIAHQFRQDSNFWYLTGLHDPELWLMIDTDTHESTIFLPSKNSYQQEWDGSFDKSHSMSTSGVDAIVDKQEFTHMLTSHVSKGKTIGYSAPPPKRIEPYGFYANPARQLLEDYIIQKVGIDKEKLVDVRLHVARLRQIKQPQEIQAIQRAIDITAKSLAVVKQKLETYRYEKQIENELSSQFYKLGSEGHAYEPIIAGGVRAAAIHYNKNQARLEDRTLLLLDVGAKVDGYAADISRTWAYGTPTKRQQDIFKACYDLQQTGISLLKPGVLLREYQQTLDKKAQKIFKSLRCSMYGRPFPHGFSHFLGLDVHDAGDYEAPLLENTVLTVEPGIYLADEQIGVRIEDDILITAHGNKNLSEDIPYLL